MKPITAYPKHKRKKIAKIRKKNFARNIIDRIKFTMQPEDFENGQITVFVDLTPAEYDIMNESGYSWLKQPTTGVL